MAQIAVVKSNKLYVKPSQSIFTQGASHVLFEKIESRESPTNNGTSNFLIQPKGDNSLLSSEAYIEVPITITKTIPVDPANTAPFGNRSQFCKQDVLALRSPASIIRNAVMVINGCNITDQTGIDDEVKHWMNVSDKDMNKYYHRGYSKWRYGSVETSQNSRIYKRALAPGDKSSASTLAETTSKWNREGRVKAGSSYDQERTAGVEWLADKIRYNSGTVVTGAVDGTAITTLTQNFTVFIPLSVGVFQFCRKNMYRRYSEAIPYCSGSLAINYYQSLNQLLEVIFPHVNGGGPDTSFFKNASC